MRKVDKRDGKPGDDFLLVGAAALPQQLDEKDWQDLVWKGRRKHRERRVAGIALDRKGWLR
jgi:hypothetical protein